MRVLIFYLYIFYYKIFHTRDLLKFQERHQRRGRNENTASEGDQTSASTTLWLVATVPKMHLAYFHRFRRVYKAADSKENQSFNWCSVTINVCFIHS